MDRIVVGMDRNMERKDHSNLVVESKNQIVGCFHLMVTRNTDRNLACKLSDLHNCNNFQHFQIYHLRDIQSIRIAAMAGTSSFDYHSGRCWRKQNECEAMLFGSITYHMILETTNFFASNLKID